MTSAQREIEKKWSDLRDLEFSAEKRMKAHERKVREIRRQIGTLEREIHDAEKEKGIIDVYANRKFDIQKGVFRLERYVFPAMIRTTLRVESDVWVDNEEKNLSLEVQLFKGNSKAEIKKTIRKMIKDLQWLLEHIPNEWG